MEEQNKKIEKEKGRKLRATRWWQNLIASTPPCYYCQKKMEKDDVTMDHIVPLSKGGKSTRGNVVPCCKECNSKKGYKTPVEMILASLEKNE